MHIGLLVPAQLTLKSSHFCHCFSLYNLLLRTALITDSVIFTSREWSQKKEQKILYASGTSLRTSPPCTIDQKLYQIENNQLPPVIHTCSVANIIILCTAHVRTCMLNRHWSVYMYMYMYVYIYVALRESFSSWPQTSMLWTLILRLLHHMLTDLTRQRTTMKRTQQVGL